MFCYTNDTKKDLKFDCIINLLLIYIHTETRWVKTVNGIIIRIYDHNLHTYIHTAGQQGTFTFVQLLYAIFCIGRWIMYVDLREISLSCPALIPKLFQHIAPLFCRQVACKHVDNMLYMLIFYCPFFWVVIIVWWYLFYTIVNSKKLWKVDFYCVKPQDKIEVYWVATIFYYELTDIVGEMPWQKRQSSMKEKTAIDKSSFYR